jgi:hypothetical protein
VRGLLHNFFTPSLETGKKIVTGHGSTRISTD